MQIKQSHREMIMFALARSDDFAIWIRYLDSRGQITERTIVPISIVDNLQLKAICVSCEEFRTFRLSRIMNVKFRLASDVLMGKERVKMMALRSVRRVDKSTETESRVTKVRQLNV